MLSIEKNQSHALVLSNHTGATDILVDAGASLSLTLLYLDAQKTSANFTLRLAKNATAHIAQVFILATHAELSLNATLEDNAKLTVNKFSLQKNHDFLKTTLMVTQIGAHSSSFYRGFACLGGSARQESDLKVSFLRGAKGAKGVEYEKVLLLSKDASCLVLPKIACGETDVDGRHGLSIGKIFVDEARYLRARGLSHAKIRKLYAASELKKLTKLLHDPEANQAIERAARAW